MRSIDLLLRSQSGWHAALPSRRFADSGANPKAYFLIDRCVIDEAQGRQARHRPQSLARQALLDQHRRV